MRCAGLGAATRREQHDVGRLQIAVDHAVLVGLIECVGDLNGNAESLVELQRSPGRRPFALAGSRRRPGSSGAAPARRFGRTGRGRARPPASPSRESIGERLALEVLHHDEVNRRLP